MNDCKEKLIERGGRTFVGIREGLLTMNFNPPLRVDWSVCCDSSHPLGDITTAYVTFDFGMTYEIRPLSTKNSGWGYNGVNKDSTLEEVILSVIRFDLFHAFTHFHLDPNYTTLHWALYGNLKDQTTIHEDSDLIYD